MPSTFGTGYLVNILTWKLWAGAYISGSSSRSASTYLDGVVSTWSASIDAAALLPGKCRNMQHVHHWHPEVLIGLDMESFVRICASLGHTGTFYSICIDTVACFEEVFCWNLKNIATWNKTRNIMAFVPCQIQKQRRFESHGGILRFEIWGWLCWCSWSRSSRQHLYHTVGCVGHCFHSSGCRFYVRTSGDYEHCWTFVELVLVWHFIPLLGLIASDTVPWRTNQTTFVDFVASDQPKCKFKTCAVLHVWKGKWLRDIRDPWGLKG